MKKTYCDHCGKEIVDFNVPVEIRFGEVHLERHDLCKECMDGLIVLFKHYFDVKEKKRGAER